MPGPLDSAEAARDKVVRIAFAVGLLLLLLIGLLEATVFVKTLFRPGFSANAVVLALGTIGSSSMLMSLWTLFHLRTWPLWRLIVLSIVSALFAALGWIVVVGAAH